MFLQEKVSDINKKLDVLKGVANIVIWGAGRHTCKLFEWTEVQNYAIKSIVDISESRKGSPCFGFIIQDPTEITWNDVGAVVISVPGQEMQIKKTLVGKLKFSGRIVILYENNDCTPFYMLYDKKVSSICFDGDYDNWRDAYNECEGYDSINILNTVSEAMNKVINGQAVWERDGCLFYETKYVYCICAAILRCAVQNENQGVRVLDIGGALGSTYFQNRNYLADVKNIEYVVAEQNNFADYGHQNLENSTLKFIYSIEHWEKQKKFDIILLSGSLQCIEQYEEIVERINKAKPHYIILDRIMVSRKRMRICKETVPESIYKSSYPIRIFSEEQIECFFGKDYVMVECDISSVPFNVYFTDDVVPSKYYVFEYRGKNERND